MSGRIINISGINPVEDPSYRYKMPSVIGKIEGKGNGIKTVIVNISDLALSLHREPAEVNKFFGCEMGAQTSYNEADDRAVVNGAHSDPQLQQCVHKYIEKFVLCPQCGLPETTYSIKQGCIWHRCAACGAKEMVDMNHKLCTFILAQDKKNKKDKEKAKKERSKKGEDDEDASKSEKKKKKKKSKEGSDEEKKKSKDGSDEEKKDKKKKDKKKKDKKKKDKKKKDKDSVEDVTDDVDELSIGSDAVGDDDARKLAVEGIKAFLKDNPDASAEETAEVVINQQMASALKSYEKIHIFLCAVITPNFFKNKEIESYSETIKKITQDNPIMQRHLIGAVEEICADLVLEPKHFPVILKQLFDQEALSEDVIFEWAFDGRSEYTRSSVNEEIRSKLRGQAEPVVAWLQEDSDSDSDDSDNESDSD
eukprot:CAMPEP_0176494582 /NCGR_PEP_ID=MMETSP0200_2-20121128/10185_1 /TAXON_ID=947934 /ORGANISM="Chaetoceros sp., Strain GSL56" /LENGTH=421 /DNA_ID=CAMNT_0017892373 /DNA_START=358 /DNA_END=1623 /DNA_ORIENTATION=-